MAYLAQIDEKVLVVVDVPLRVRVCLDVALSREAEVSRSKTRSRHSSYRSPVVVAPKDLRTSSSLRRALGRIVLVVSHVEV